MQYKGRLGASAIDWMLINAVIGWNRSVMVSTDRCFLPASQHWNDTRPSWADSLCLNHRKICSILRSGQWTQSEADQQLGLKRKSKLRASAQLSHAHIQRGTHAYLWGIFLGEQNKCSHLFCRTSTDLHLFLIMFLPFLLLQFIYLWHNKCTGESFALTL